MGNRASAHRWRNDDGTTGWLVVRPNGEADMGEVSDPREANARISSASWAPLTIITAQHPNDPGRRLDG